MNFIIDILCTVDRMLKINSLFKYIAFIFAVSSAMASCSTDTVPVDPTVQHSVCGK